MASFASRQGARALLLILPLALGACNLTRAPEIDGSLEDITGSAQNETKSRLSLAKRHFRDKNYGLAEEHFRKAVEETPGDAEAWLGLAASYDQLRRFDLADRAYDEAVKIAGPQASILNNRGYSRLLRGDSKRAAEDLRAAQVKDPNNPQIANNIKLLQQARPSR